MRVLSYNIHKGIGGRDRRYRLDRIIRVLREQDADFVCLQEVDRNVRRSRFDHQPALLAEAVGAVSSLDQLVFPRGEGGYGNLILSSWPFAESDQISIRKGRRKPRGAQFAEFETPSGPLTPDPRPSRPERTRATLAGRDLVWSHAHFDGQGHLPAVLAGDSNDWRDRWSTARSPATGSARPPGRRGDSGPSPPTCRWRRSTRSSREARSRSSRAHLVKSRLTRRASDHLPLVVDFTIIT